MRLLLLVLLTAGASRAQPVAHASLPGADTTVVSAHPSDWQQVGLLAGGVAGGALLVAVASPTAETVPGMVLTVAMLPVGSALGVHLAGRVVGVDGSLRRGLIGATVGSVVGVTAMMGLIVASEQVPIPEGGCDFVCPATLVAISFGAGIALVAPAYLAASRYPVRVAPVALAAPTGEPAVGLSLRVGM